MKITVYLNPHYLSYDSNLLNFYKPIITDGDSAQLDNVASFRFAFSPVLNEKYQQSFLKDTSVIIHRGKIEYVNKSIDIKKMLYDMLAICDKPQLKPFLDFVREVAGEPFGLFITSQDAQEILEMMENARACDDGYMHVNIAYRLFVKLFFESMTAIVSENACGHINM